MLPARKQSLIYIALFMFGYLLVPTFGPSVGRLVGGLTTIAIVAIGGVRSRQQAIEADRNPRGRLC